MFPTQGKSKIPKSLAYPANAKLISEALADVPQANEFSIAFRFLKNSASRKKSQTWPLLDVSYSYWKPNQFTPRCVEERGGGKPQWAIHVEPVPLEIKHHVQELLKSQGLPKVHSWLLARGHVTGSLTFHSLRVLYNQEFDRLEYQGTQPP